MPRYLKIGIIVLATGYLIAGGYYREIVSRLESVVEVDERAPNPFTAPHEPLYKPDDPPMAVKVFFPTRDGSPLLSTDERTIFASAELSNRVKQVLGELVEGPTRENLTSLPTDTRIEEAFIAEDGTAFVDFNDALVKNHPGGILNEQATIYSIVNSLTYNLPEIRRVRVLIGGVEKETLAGHCILSLPLTMDLSISDVAFAEERPAGALERRKVP